MPDYISGTDIQAQGEQPESDTGTVFDALAAAVCRLFDRECEVPDNFFGVAPDIGSETTKSLRTNGTKYLNVGPYVGPLTAFTLDGVDRLGDGTYSEQDGFIVFDGDDDVDAGSAASVSARFGFETLAADIVQACIEQALFMWRKKDLAFTNESGVSASVVMAEFSPTFKAVTKRYRGLYSRNNYFS